MAKIKKSLIIKHAVTFYIIIGYSLNKVLTCIGNNMHLKPGFDYLFILYTHRNFFENLAVSIGIHES